MLLKIHKMQHQRKKKKKKKKRSQIQLIEPIEVKQLFVLIPPPKKKQVPGGVAVRYMNTH